MADLVRTEGDLVSNRHFGGYYDYMLKTLMKYGDHVSDKLVTRKHFLQFADLEDKKLMKETVWWYVMYQTGQVFENMYKLDIEYSKHIDIYVEIVLSTIFALLGEPVSYLVSAFCLKDKPKSSAAECAKDFRLHCIIVQCRTMVRMKQY